MCQKDDWFERPQTDKDRNFIYTREIVEENDQQYRLGARQFEILELVWY